MSCAPDSATRLQPDIAHMLSQSLQQRQSPLSDSSAEPEPAWCALWSASTTGDMSEASACCAHGAAALAQDDRNKTSITRQPMCLRARIMRPSLALSRIQFNISGSHVLSFHGDGTRCLTITRTMNSRISSITKNHPLMPPNNQTMVCTALTHAKSYNWSRQIGHTGIRSQRSDVAMKQNQHRTVAVP